MKFYNIECKGKLTLEKVAGLPDFDNTRDEARVVYNTNDGIAYSGNASRGGWDPTAGFESGTKMLFKQGSAPVGWTFASEDNDRVLINTSTQGDGGVTGGSWTISGCSVDYHTLTESQIPAHTHGSAGAHTHEVREYGSGDEFGMHNGIYRATDIDTTGAIDTESAGTHTHASFGGSSGHNHGFSSDGNWRPSYAKVITCTKD